jgi:hypothetical protein
LADILSVEQVFIGDRTIDNLSSHPKRRKAKSIVIVKDLCILTSSFIELSGNTG